MSKANRIFALITMVLGGIILWLSSTTNQSLSKFDIGTGAFPAMCGVLLVFLGIILLLTNLKNKDNSEVDFGNRYTLLYFGIIFLYILLLKPLGFIVDSLWIMPVMMYIMGSRNPKSLALTTIIAVAVIYIAFRYGFSVILPKGILKGIL